MIDMDDTITIDGYIDVVNKFLKKNITYEDIPNYWVDDIVPESQLPKYLKFFYTKTNVYDYVKINENAIEVIEELTKYYEVIICSAYTDYRYIENCVNIVPYKHKWLLKHLPSVNPDNFIFTSNKKCIQAEIKIDDKISNLEDNISEVKLLMTAYHNKNISDEKLKEKNIIRVNNWNDVAEILLKH